MNGEEKDGPSNERDLIYIGGATERGDAYQILRATRQGLEVGELRPTKEGEPVQGELVRLTKLPQSDRLFEAEVLLPDPRDKRHGHGPPQVATEAWRNNWEAIFGSRTKTELPN